VSISVVPFVIPGRWIRSGDHRNGEGRHAMHRLRAGIASTSTVNVGGAPVPPRVFVRMEREESVLVKDVL